MKNSICFLCVVLLIASFAGCGKSGSYNSQNPQQGEMQSDLEQKELTNEELAEIVAKGLNVPDQVSGCYVVSEMYYWDAAGRHYKNITFKENDKMVAAADVDPYSGELLKNICKYDSSY